MSRRELVAYLLIVVAGGGSSLPAFFPEWFGL